MCAQNAPPALRRQLPRCSDSHLSTNPPNEPAELLSSLNFGLETSDSTDSNFKVWTSHWLVVRPPHSLIFENRKPIKGIRSMITFESCKSKFFYLPSSNLNQVRNWTSLSLTSAFVQSKSWFELFSLWKFWTLPEHVPVWTCVQIKFQFQNQW